MTSIKILLAGAVATAAIAFSSCSGESDGPGTEENRFVNFVTLTENTPQGSVMTFRKEGDSPLITLTSTQQFDPVIFTPGTRVVVDYIPASGDGYASGAVKLLQAMNTEGQGAPVEAKTSEETGRWASDLVTINQVERSGEYLNLIFTAATRRDPKECAVYVDAATIGTEQPCLHLIFQASDTGVAAPFAFYASYNISEIWNNEATKSIRVYFPDQSTQPWCVIVKEETDIPLRPMDPEV